MNCKVSCSFGEIIDKMTILKIKIENSQNESTLENVKYELNTILADIPEASDDDELFQNLFFINKQLWNLEDKIREKSTKMEYDQQYIKYAEDIHKMNDVRYLIKKRINQKYNSIIVEEKIHQYSSIINSSKKSDTFETNKMSNQARYLNMAKLCYSKGEYRKSYEIIIDIFKTIPQNITYDEFYVDLICSYMNVYFMFQDTNHYVDQIQYLHENVSSLNVSEILREHTKQILVHHFLRNLQYRHAYDYLNKLGSITGPGVQNTNMSFFKKEDIGKTILLYDGGGIGDKFMLSRFIPKVCDLYPDNYVLFFVNDNLCWIFTKLFKSYTRLRIIPYSKNHLIDHFDYHCNLLSLVKYLNYSYNDIYFTPMLKSIEMSQNERNKPIIEKIQKNTKPTYIFNWKGNDKNASEKYNRCIALETAIPLLKLDNIQWIVITKDISEEDKRVLEQFNIPYYGNIIDTGTNCFEDTMEIMKYVQGVISTDTSVVHLSANLDIKTFVLLTKGCEWRWNTQNERNHWYPNIELIQQSEQGKWDDVITKTKNILTKCI